MGIIERYIDKSKTVQKFVGDVKWEYYYPENQYQYFNPEQFGTQFPRNYWVLDYGSKTAFELRVDYEQGMFPKGEWKDTTYVESRKTEDASIGIINYNAYQGTREDDGDYLTQTLFNEDEDFEVLIPNYVYGSTTEKHDRDDDGEIDLEFTREGEFMFAGYKAIKENGDVVCTFDFGDEFTANSSWYYEPDYDVVVFSINGKTYLAATGYRETDEGSKSSLIVFRIDPSTSNVRMVRADEDVSSITRQYDLQGRQAVNVHRGIVIQKEGNERRSNIRKLIKR